jgi:hypothetical protein
MAIAQIVVTLVSFFLGYQTDKMNSGSWYGIIPAIVAIVVLYLGIKAVREEQEGKYMTYGKAVSTGALIALYSCLIGAIYTYIHFRYINPNFPDYVIESSRVKWAAAGMPESKMDGAEKGVRMFTKPIIQAGFVLIVGILFDLILTLIIAAFLKRNPPVSGQAGA